MKNIKIVIFILVVYSCMPTKKEDSDVWDLYHKGELVYEMDSIDLQKFTFKGSSIVISYNELIKTLGEPDSIKLFNCDSIIDVFNYEQKKTDRRRYPFAGFVYYLNNGRVHYRVDPEVCYLRYFKFENSDPSVYIESPWITLNSSTTFKDTKVFRTSYKLKDFHKKEFLHSWDERDWKYLQTIPIAQKPTINGMYLTMYMGFYKEKLMELEIVDDNHPIKLEFSK